MVTFKSARLAANHMGIGAGFSWLVGPFRSRHGLIVLLAILALVVTGFGLGWALTRGPVSTVAIETAPVELDSTQVRDLLSSLTRYGIDSNDTEIDAVYGHPLLLSALGHTDESPDTVVVFMTENIHDDNFLSPSPTAYLTIDGSGRTSPINVELLNNDIHHRSSKLTYFVPGADTFANSTASHTFSLEVAGETAGDGLVESRANVLTWKLPVALPSGLSGGLDNANGISATDLPEDLVVVPLSLSVMTDALKKERDGIAYDGVSGIEANVTYATPEYFGQAFPARLQERYSPETGFVFVITESTHATDLPGELPTLILHTPGENLAPELLEERVTSSHHRVFIARFAGSESPQGQIGQMALEFPDGSTFAWALPVAYDRTGSLSPFGISWASLLAVMAGMVAAMWPCLLQLTVFFIPSLAGLSMEQVSNSVVVVKRFQVVKAALFFVLGFTIVYTLAGALIGYAAQELGESANFETIQRIIGIIGGIIILILALRVAVKVRAPLVCKMPILSRMGRKGTARPWEMMFAGLAFATGCMTCFGAALVISMVVYVGLSGSVFFGALILFLFSMGMGIPLIIGAVLMTKLLPVLGKMEKWVHRLGLASSLLMVGFAVLLISGNYMVMTEWVYGAFGMPPLP